MSSPPTPNTSVKAAHLCTSKPKKKENPFSFPSITRLNPFCKKPLPQPSSPVEPYEVAPGIWSTEATAKVFGYLDTIDKRARLRVQGTGPIQEANEKSVPINGPLSERKQAHFAEKTDQCETDASRDEAEASARLGQNRRDEHRNKIRSNWSGPRRGRMRTVSRDDQLVERGANPRTGLVSPFVVSDNSEECLRNDYIAGGKFASAGQRRTRSGKWKQDSLGWSLEESPLLSPIAQSMSDKMSGTVSAKRLEDQLLVEMPGRDNPSPENMTEAQIEKYQEGIARAYKRGGGSVSMLDPDTLPTPRQWTPEGPSTPPTKLYKIQRKEVGSGVGRKSVSSDTVIVNANKRASSLPTPKKDNMKRQKFKITTPSNTPKGSSFASCANISNATKKTDPFLSRGSRITCSQTASVTQSQSYQDTGQAHQCLQNESQSCPSLTLSGPPPASPALRQYLPHLHFLPPSHFANLETSSYRRPPQLPLKPLEQQRQAAGDAYTTTFTTTSTKGPSLEQRPKLQRQEGYSVVGRVNHLSPWYETPLNGYRQGSAPRTMQTYPSATPVDTLHTPGLAAGTSQVIGPTEKADIARDLAETRYQRKKLVPADCLRQHRCENQRAHPACPTQTTQEPSLASASTNVARERIRRNQSGDGCTRTYGHLGDESKAVPGKGFQRVADDKEPASLPAELTIGGDNSVWFAGQWAEVEDKGEFPDLTTLMHEEPLARRRSVMRKAANVKLWLYFAEALVEPLTKLHYIQQPLHQMICHVVRTLHHASPALTTFRAANTTTRDHVRATKDLALAAVYLLLLLNLLMVLRRVLVFVIKVLCCVWHPAQTILVIIEWCFVG